MLLSSSVLIYFLGGKETIHRISWIHRSWVQGSYIHNYVELSCRQVLKDLCLFSNQPPLLCCDKMLAIQLARNPVFHSRTKHVEINFHFVCERVTRKDRSLNPSTNCRFVYEVTYYNQTDVFKGQTHMPMRAFVWGEILQFTTNKVIVYLLFVIVTYLCILPFVSLLSVSFLCVYIFSCTFSIE